MTRYLRRSAYAIALAVGALPSAAVAGPVIHVRVATPAIVAPAPHLHVVHRPLQPGPHHVWVAPGWRTDSFGHTVWVAGYWRAPMVAVRPAPTRVVRVVRR